MAVDPEDFALVTAQLGREPQAMLGIRKRCAAGHPAVIETLPLVPGRRGLEPFPTHFWLTCPEIVRQISRLEMGGLIQEFDARLASDEEFAQAMRQAHLEYVRDRRAAVPAELAAQAPALLEGLESRGIGGIANWRSTKCLHLHFAHHLARFNPIGAKLAKAHGIGLCPAAD